MTAMIAECAENARQCKWYASKTKNAEEFTAVRAWLNSVRARPTGVRPRTRHMESSKCRSCRVTITAISYTTRPVGRTLSRHFPPRWTVIKTEACSWSASATLC